MNKKINDEVAAIEAAQGELRESIEQSKILSIEVDRLVKKHKVSLKDQVDRKPAK